MSARTVVLSEFDSGQDLLRWGLAGAIVLATHAGLMAGYLLAPASDPPGAPSAPVIIIDFAPVPVAPASPLDLAPGPEMLEAQPMKDSAPEQNPEVVEPLPKVEQKSEVALPAEELKKAEKKPEEENPVEKPPDKKREENQAPAPRTTAAPRSDSQTAVAPRAPSPGSADSRAAMARWRDLVAAHLQRHKRYPRSAESSREQGTVILSFTVNRQGHVLARRVMRSSGHSSLDREVLAMIARAQPLPAFPAAMTLSQVNLNVPIHFSLR